MKIQTSISYKCIRCRAVKAEQQYDNNITLGFGLRICNTCVQDFITHDDENNEIKTLKQLLSPTRRYKWDP